MRRLIGLIALLVLVFGAVWLVQNGYDRTELAGLTDFPPVLSTDESVPPPDAAPEDPAKAEAPMAAPEATESEASAMAPETPAAESAGAMDAAEAPPAETMTADPAMPPGVAEKMAALEPAQGEAEAGPPVGVVPTFDIVRVEPSGETVIAGLAAPLAVVEVLNHADPIAMAEANERGEWALVVEVPLPPGAHDLAIRTTSRDRSEVTLSDQRVAVLVPDGAKEEPLVVLNMPDAPSTVMQLPAEGEGEREVAVVPAEPEPMAEKPAMGGGSEMAAASEPEAAVPEAAPMAEKPAIAGKTDMVSAPESAPMAEKPAMAGETEMAAAPAPEGAAGETPEAMAGSDTASTEEMAAVEEPAPPPEPQPTVGVAAVEAETNGELYIAGTATTPEPVRVYIDDELVGEATPTENGTWLVETTREMPPDEYKIRADQVEAGTGEVIARAEVPFEREIEVAVLEQSSESADPGSAEASHSLAGPMKVIIKRGDNLWRISREMYGHGVRYSTIYQANQDQIRNPDLIYPGQVFLVPAGNTAWEGQ